MPTTVARGMNVMAGNPLNGCGRSAAKALVDRPIPQGCASGRTPGDLRDSAPCFRVGFALRCGHQPRRLDAGLFSSLPSRPQTFGIMALALESCRAPDPSDTLRRRSPEGAWPLGAPSRQPVGSMRGCDTVARERALRRRHVVGISGIARGPDPARRGCAVGPHLRSRDPRQPDRLSRPRGASTSRACADRAGQGCTRPALEVPSLQGRWLLRKSR